MLPLPAGGEASTGVGAFVYERHRPERTLLYQLFEEYYPALKEHLMAVGRALPGYVEQAFGRSCASCACAISASMHVTARLAALVPKPRVNLTRFHGVFAPNSKHRALVTPARRGKGNKSKAPDDGKEKTPVERRAAMSWAQRLKRVFNIDIETCSACGGAVKVIACIRLGYERDAGGRATQEAKAEKIRRSLRRFHP